MTKTFRACAIFFISTLWLMIMRLIFSAVNLSDNLSGWLFSFFNQIIGLGVIPIVLYKFWAKGDVKKDFRIKGNINPCIYLIAILIGVLLYYFTIGISSFFQIILRILGFTHINSAGTIFSGPEVLVMELLTTALLPAIFEEITDRGLSLAMLNEVKSEKVKIFMVALLFALAHQNVMQTGYTFIGGLVLAYIALKSGSIIPSMIIHFINNGLSVLFQYSSQTNGILGIVEERLYLFINTNYLLAVLTWILTAAALIVLLKTVKKLSKQPPIEEGVVEDIGIDTRLDRLFGINRGGEITVKATKTHWYEYAFLYASIAVSVATTIMSFIWGVLR